MEPAKRCKVKALVRELQLGGRVWERLVECWSIEWAGKGYSLGQWHQEGGVLGTR